MSDTPETDELWHKRPEQFEVYKLARKLERERDEARKERDDLKTRLALMDDFKSEILQAYATAIGCARHESPVRKAELLVKERDELRADVERLKAESELYAGWSKWKAGIWRISQVESGPCAEWIAEDLQSAMKGAE